MHTSYVVTLYTSQRNARLITFVGLYMSCSLAHVLREFSAFSRKEPRSVYFYWQEVAVDGLVEALTVKR